MRKPFRKRIDVCNQTRTKVRELMERHWTIQGRLATAAGVEVNKFSRWINEKPGCFLWYEELWQIAKALGVSMDYLCDDAINAPDVPSSPIASETGTRPKGAGGVVLRSKRGQPKGSHRTPR